MLCDDSTKIGIYTFLMEYVTIGVRRKKTTAKKRITIIQLEGNSEFSVKERMDLEE